MEQKHKEIMLQEIEDATEKKSHEENKVRLTYCCDCNRMIQIPYDTPQPYSAVCPSCRQKRDKVDNYTDIEEIKQRLDALERETRRYR